MKKLFENIGPRSPQKQEKYMVDALADKVVALTGATWKGVRFGLIDRQGYHKVAAAYQDAMALDASKTVKAKKFWYWARN